VLCHNDVHEGNVLVAPAGDGWRVTGFDEFAGLLAGYGPLPADGLARIELYRLYHALELWDWFAEIGDTGPLDGIAADIRELAG
jgi:hygromycin-B 7''-O-kinase